MRIFASAARASAGSYFFMNTVSCLGADAPPARRITR